MNFNPQKHHRRSIRLQNYDYTQSGAYFITINTRQREKLFGEIVNEEMMLSECGRVVEEEWLRTAQVRKNVELDVYVVMPNHFHAIIVLSNDTVGASRRLALTKGLQAGSLGAIMAQFKSIVTKRINALRSTPSAPVWQRNYYEHIIRNDDVLKRIRDYIVANPSRWKEDENNPQRHDQVRDEWE
jgi:REP element-mobilizing transposase RayT